MKKIAVITCLMVLLTLGVPHVQAAFNGGIKAGINLTTLNLYEPTIPGGVIGGILILETNFKRRAGLTIGGFYNLKMANGFSIQPEIYYSQKKYRSQILPEFYSYETDTYIEIPLLIKYKKSMFEIFAGPYLAFLLDAKGYLQISTDTRLEFNKEDINPKDTEWGLVLGAGFKWRRYVFDVRYTMAFSDFRTGTFTLGEDSYTWTAKHNAIVFLIGMEF